MGIGVVGVLIVAQITLLGVNSVRNHEPILGLRLEGQAIGWLYDGDFRKQADAIVQTYETKNFTVKAADKTSTISLRQLGVKTDTAQLYTRLLATGRSGNMFRRLADQDLALLGGRSVSIGQPSFNSGLSKTYIAELEKNVQIAPIDASFAYENQKAVIRPDHLGRTIDTDAAVAALHRVNPTLDAQVILPIKQPAATMTASLLAPLLPQVQAIAQKPLIIEAGSSKTTLSSEQLIALVVPKVVSDTKDPHKKIVQLSFDEAKLNAIVDGVVKQAVVAPKPTILNGNRLVQQGQSGVQVEDTHTLEHVLTVLIQRETGVAAPDTAEIPLVTVNPPIVQQFVASARTRTGTGLVRLTFDDGPGAHTEQVLDILSRYNVHATFYVIGRNVQRYPTTMQRIVREGHQVGNHSFSHADLSRLSRTGIMQELTNTQQAIQAACGVTPTAFRPPYGALNQTVREVASSMGMSIDLWSVDPRDWAQPGSSVITQRVLGADSAGSVILLHVLYQQTIDALPAIIEGIRAQGYTLE
ncbi:MAG TPA: polysaccharide deacetylase family protein [Nevskiaceae bacterium]|nr:polysaccharide deacetylase family protein [Nevskiaceae bacterium]